LASPQTIDGWNGLDFRFFPESCVKRIAALRDQLAIHDTPPKINEVVGGMIAARTRAGASVVSGVYDRSSRLADGSVPFRGRTVWKRIAEPETKKLGRIFDDSRVAYYLGYANVHYGHFLLETISRAWAWRDYKLECVPVFQTPPTRLPPFVRAFFELIPGLSENLEVVAKATRFSRVVVAHPAFVIAHEAFSEFKRLCVGMAERALRDFPARTEQPLYLSRAGLNPARQRTLLGEERLERFLVQQGFLVVRPETLSVVEQITLMNTHKYIVSPLGSACHTRLFACGATTCLILSGDRINSNYLLCDRLCQGGSHYANVLSLPKLGVGVHLPAEPLMIDEDRVLSLLRDFGLINSGAKFSESGPGLKEYKRRWVLAADEFSRKSGDAAIGNAAREISSTLEN
jgi:hypothetical protein